jgi:hypothetical protein
VKTVKSVKSDTVYRVKSFFSVIVFVSVMIESSNSNRGIKQGLLTYTLLQEATIEPYYLRMNDIVV